MQVVGTLLRGSGRAGAKALSWESAGSWQKGHVCWERWPRVKEAAAPLYCPPNTPGQREVTEGHGMTPWGVSLPTAGCLAGTKAGAANKLFLHSASPERRLLAGDTDARPCSQHL